MPRKRHWSSSREPINRYGKYRRPWMHFNVDNFKPCNLSVVWQERSILLSKVPEPLFSVVTTSSVKTSNGVLFKGRTSHKGVLSDMGFRYDEMINDKRFTLHQFVCFNLKHNTCRLCYEQPNIVHRCHKYLRWMGCNRSEGKPELLFLGNWASWGTFWNNSSFHSFYLIPYSSVRPSLLMNHYLL